MKLNILKHAKLQAIVCALAGVVAGLLYSIGGMFVDLATIGWNHGTNLAFLAIPLMPIYFGIAGFATGIVGAWLYNFFQK